MRVIDLFDDYLEGRLEGEELKEFKSRLLTDATFAKAFEEHQQLIETLRSSAMRNELRTKLRDIHSKEIGNAKVLPLQKTENFAQKHARTIAVAASTAFIAVLSTVAILSAGGYLFKQQSNQITDLNRVVRELKASSDGIVQGIRKTTSRKASYAPANIEGSAFAINNKGFILTSFHMVNGADSIFIQNAQTERSLTRLIYCDPKLDLAILKVENEQINKNWQVPFSLKEKSADIGEKVFTMGYPRRDMVYGEGSLSSMSGYSNDTSMYQISIPVNPGNSGGPLLDESGNVIGVIRGKISGAEATSFAIKAPEIINSIKGAATDSVRTQVLATAGKKSGLRNMKRSDQVRKISPYVFNVLIYKGE
jgi:S1-C subfamily serine protease